MIAGLEFAGVSEIFSEKSAESEPIAFETHTVTL